MPRAFPKIELHVHLEGTVRADTLRAIAKRNDYALPDDVTDLLPKVKAPTLVMHVRGDQVQPFEAGRELAAGIPGAHFVTGWQTLLTFSALAGLALGVSLTAGLLHYRGDEPVNVAMFFAATVGVQWLHLVSVGAWIGGLVWLLIALRFVNPTQLVSRVKDQTTAGAH